MAEQTSKQLLQEAAALSREGKKRQSRKVVRKVIQNNPADVRGWWALAQVANTQEEKRKALQRVLHIRPDHARASAMLKEMKEDSPASIALKATGVLLLIVLGVGLVGIIITALANQPVDPRANISYTTIFQSGSTIPIAVDADYTGERVPIRFTYPEAWSLAESTTSNMVFLSSRQSVVNNNATRNHLAMTLQEGEVVIAVGVLPYERFEAELGGNIETPTALADAFATNAYLTNRANQARLEPVEPISAGGRSGARSRFSVGSVDESFMVFDAGNGNFGFVAVNTPRDQLHRFESVGMDILATLDS